MPTPNPTLINYSSSNKLSISTPTPISYVASPTINNLPLMIEQSRPICSSPLISYHTINPNLSPILTFEIVDGVIVYSAPL